MLSPNGWRAAVRGRATDVGAAVAASDAFSVGAADGVATSHVVWPGYRAHLTSGRGTGDLHTCGDCRLRSPGRTRSTACLWQLSLTAQCLGRRCWSSPAAAPGRCGDPLSDTSLAAGADGARSYDFHFCLVAVTFHWGVRAALRQAGGGRRRRHVVGGHHGRVIGGHCGHSLVVNADTSSDADQEAWSAPTQTCCRPPKLMRARISALPGRREQLHL